MVGKRNNKRRSTRPKRNRGILTRMAPPPSTISYKGPISVAPQDEISVTLYDSFDVSFSSSAAIVLKFDNNPSSARNWTEYSTAWNHYRVLGIRYRYYPSQPVNTSNNPLFGVQSIVHGTAASPASLAQAMSTGVARPFQPYKAFTRNWRMQEIAEAAYVATSAPASTSNTLVIYGSQAGTGVDVGTVMIEYLVQFKTHTL